MLGFLQNLEGCYSFIVKVALVLIAEIVKNNGD